MRHRVALVTRMARGGLAAVGIGLLLWWPISYRLFTQVISPWPFTATEIRVSQGLLMLIVERNPLATGQDPTWAITRDDGIPLGRSLARPHWGEFGFNPVPPGYFRRWVDLPLWQLAALALLWPTLIHLRRRRQGGRGFAIEPRLPATAASSHPPASNP